MVEEKVCVRILNAHSSDPGVDAYPHRREAISRRTRGIRDPILIRGGRVVQPTEVVLRRKETEKGRKAAQILKEAGVSFATIESETFVPILYWGGRCYVGLSKIRGFAKGLNK